MSRLEEIKKMIKDIEEADNDDFKEEYSFKLIKEHGKHIIQQAEQLKELKESIHIITTVRKPESHEQVFLIKKAVNDLNE